MFNLLVNLIHPLQEPLYIRLLTLGSLSCSFDGAICTEFLHISQIPATSISKNNMRTLTNNYQDCELLNLGTNANGHGPYVIRQNGVPPGSSSSQEDRFLLRKDGIWVLDVTAYNLPEEQFVFQNAAELYATVEELGGNPEVEDKLPPEKSRAELNAAIETTISRVWNQIKEVRAQRLTMPGM